MTKDCIIYFLSLHPVSLSKLTLSYIPTLHFFSLFMFPLYPPSTCNLPSSPPSTPSLFLANLKFVRRLRLLDGWPLIFCELHLAQTSLRPWCILLTAALVAGLAIYLSPGHPMLTHYRRLGTSLTPTSLATACMQTHLKTTKNSVDACVCA